MMNTKKPDSGGPEQASIGPDVVLARNPRVTTSTTEDSGRVHTPPAVSTTYRGSIGLSTLRLEERELLGLADGRRSVEELARLSTMPLNVAQRHLRALCDRGILVEADRTKSSVEPVDPAHAPPVDAAPQKPADAELDIPDPANTESLDSGDGSSALTRAIDEYLELAASAFNNAAAVEESSRPTVAMSAIANEPIDAIPAPAVPAPIAAASETKPGSGPITPPPSHLVGDQRPSKASFQSLKPNVTQFWIPAMVDMVGGTAAPSDVPKPSNTQVPEAVPAEKAASGSSPSASPPGSGPTVVVNGSRPSAPLSPAPSAEGPAITKAGAPKSAPASAPKSVPLHGGAPGGPSPFRVGGYEVATRIAQGGMGSIYVCRRAGESGFQRLFTLKVVRQHSSQREEAVKSFKREARIGSLLNHANLQTVLDVGSYKEQPFLILDYVEGTNLSELISEDHRGPVPVIVAIMLDILRGLHHAHKVADEKGVRLGLVHGDVSPQNVLVGVDGLARLTDFGSATFTGEGRAHDPKWVATGKPAYMAPEQLRAEPLDARTDVFAAGILMWSALTGQKLFSGETYDETIMKVLRKKIPAPSSFGAPAFLDDICLKALSRAPEGRYATAEEMARDLQRVAAGENALATAAEVGQWVRRESGEALTEQRRRIQLMFGTSRVSPGRVYTPSATRAPAPTMVLQAQKSFQTPKLGAHKTLSPRTVFMPGGPRSQKNFWETWKIVIVSALLALPVTLTIGYLVSNLLVSRAPPPPPPRPANAADAALSH